jgi:hypothetical protein
MRRTSVSVWDTEFFGLPVCFFAYRLLTWFVGVSTSGIPVTYWVCSSHVIKYLVLTWFAGIKPSEEVGEIPH